VASAVPPLFANARESAAWRYVEFFTAANFDEAIVKG
jgi:hypothetical protein